MITCKRCGRELTNKVSIQHKQGSKCRADNRVIGGTGRGFRKVKKLSAKTERRHARIEAAKAEAISKGENKFTLNGDVTYLITKATGTVVKLGKV